MTDEDTSVTTRDLASRRARGELGDERLRLAAALGDEAAIQVLGAPAVWWPRDDALLEE